MISRCSEARERTVNRSEWSRFVRCFWQPQLFDYAIGDRQSPIDDGKSLA
jgi:hypothetical protein